jgi:exonuclease III
VRVVAWNVEKLASRLGELAGVVEALGAPDVLRLQEIRVRAADADKSRTLARSLDAARVDYFLVSPELVDRVRDARIHERHPWSDHAPISIVS